MRTPASLGQRGQTTRLPIPPPPQISCRPRNPKLLAQRGNPLSPAHRSNHKLHPLFVHVPLFPRHRLRPPRPETLSAVVKDVLATTVKDDMAPYTEGWRYTLHEPDRPASPLKR